MTDLLASILAPRGAAPSARVLVAGRALRAFVDGYVAVLLPAYLLALGLDAWAVGVLATATLLGSALATLAVGAWGHRFAQRALLAGAAVLMIATGLAFASLSHFWPLLLVAFVGTLNPSSGDVSVFLPLEHAQLANAASAMRAPRCSPATACSRRWRRRSARSRPRRPPGSRKPPASVCSTRCG